MAEQIRAAGVAYLKQARAICDRIDRENRDFTDAERTELAGLLEQARRQMKRVKATGYELVSPGLPYWETEQWKRKRHTQKANDEALRDAVLALGAGDEIIGGVGGLTIGSGAMWSNDFQKNYRGSMSGSKALIEPVGSIQVSDPITTLPGLAEKVQTLLQLIPTEKTENTDGVSFLRESVRIHEAAAIAAGQPKPESIYTITKVDDRLRMVSHLTQGIPRQYLWNLAVLGRYLDHVLREGLILELERIIINGSEALLDEFPGLLATPGIQQVAWSVDALTTCRKAITALQVLSIEPGGFVFCAQDWETLELTEDATEAYKLKGTNQQLPIDRAKRKLWGVAVALSRGLDEGTGLLVDFRGSTRLWMGMTRIDWSESTYDSSSGKSDFERNLVRWRAEVEAFAAATRPAGVVEIDLTVGS